MTLLVQTEKSHQVRQFLDIMLWILQVKLEHHYTLHTCRGVVQCWHWSDVSNNSITAVLTDQVVIATCHTAIWHDRVLQPSDTSMFTFNRPKVPEYVMARYLHLPVLPFVPSPHQCFKCQHYGNGQSPCAGTAVCNSCRKVDHSPEPCQLGLLPELQGSTSRFVKGLSDLAEGVLDPSDLHYAGFDIASGEKQFVMPEEITPGISYASAISSLSWSLYPCTLTELYSCFHLFGLPHRHLTGSMWAGVGCLTIVKDISDGTNMTPTPHLA